MAVSAGALLLGFRFVLFVLFVISNAIIASVAVWSRSMPMQTGRDIIIDNYLTFVGAFGVVFIIPIVAIDLFRKHAVSSRVWFESLWVGIFALLELGGASALSANMSGLTCSAVTGTVDICTSAMVLAAFTWITTVLLLIYLLALTLSAILHHEEGVPVWQSSVRFFPWYDTRASLNSAPSSPGKQWKKPLQLASAAPQRHPHTQARMQEKDLEARREPTYEPSRPAPAPPVSEQPYPSAEPASLYPATLKSSLPTIPRPPQPLDSAPAPLGDWPRRQPERIPRQQQLSISNSTPQSATVPVGSAAAASRPRHPRNGSTSSLGRQRPIPPPLDLTKISAYRQIEERASRR